MIIIDEAATVCNYVINSNKWLYNFSTIVFCEGALAGCKKVLVTS